MAMFAVEVLRDRAWLTFLMALAAQIGVSHQLRYLMHAVWISVLVVGIVWWLGQDYFGPTINIGAVAIPGGLAMAFAGLLLIEQLYRNSPPESRWSIKPLALGVGGILPATSFFFRKACCSVLSTRRHGWREAPSISCSFP